MNKSDKKIAIVAALFGALTIIIGAFGAHGLSDQLDGKSLSSFEVGVRYQMYHSLALLILGFAPRISVTTKKWVFWLFVSGIILFSGSIYLLSLDAILSVELSFMGPITPIGGILLVIGWLRLVYGLIRLK